MTDIDREGCEIIVAKIADRDGVFNDIGVVWGGILGALTPTQAVAFALRLYQAANGIEPENPMKELVPLTVEEAEAVDKELSRSPSPFAPTAAERALAIELFLEHLDGTPETWQRLLLNYAGNILREKNAVAAVWALVNYGLVSFVGAVGNTRPVRARMKYDLAVEQEIAKADWEAAE